MIITLTGPTACGKSTALRFFMDSKRSHWMPKIIPKFVTRDKRNDDGDEVIHVKSIPEDCDLVYEQYGTRYGFSSGKIREFVSDGKDCLIIVNDVRVLDDLRTLFGPQLITVFVFKENPRVENYRRIAKSRGVTSEDEIMRRIQKAQAIFRIYIENITLFNRTVLNVGDLLMLELQVERIIDFIVEKKKLAGERIFKR
jgi:guanylate kinase